MKENPYAAPQAKLVPTLNHRFRWKSALPAATVAFLSFPVFVVVVSLGRGVVLPDFLLNTGFLGTLALISGVTACALERTKLSTWLYWVLTTVVTLALLVVVVVALRAITR